MPADQGPGTAVRLFLDAYNDGDIGTVDAVTTARFRSSDRLVRTSGLSKDADPFRQDQQIDQSKIDGNRAVVTAHNRRGTPMIYMLRLEGGSWRVDGFSGGRRSPEND